MLHLRGSHQYYCGCSDNTVKTIENDAVCAFGRTFTLLEDRY